LVFFSLELELGTALDELSLFEEPCSAACGVFWLVSAAGVALVAGLLLGSVLLDDDGGAEGRSTKREVAARQLPLFRKPCGLTQALKLDPHPQVCFALGFLKLNPLWPNCPST